MMRRLPKLKSKRQFVSDARRTHGRKYIYAKAAYAGAQRKVVITCRRHGDFLQTPDAHINKGDGCPKCAKEERLERLRLAESRRFLGRARAKFGRRFDYSAVAYKTMWVPVAITCRKRGEFSIAPVTHLLSKTGCPKCSRQLRHPRASYSTGEFVANARRVHGKRYDYSSVRCENSSSPVAIRCRQHGIFRQTPTSHLNGHGCPSCARIARAVAAVRTLRKRIVASREQRERLFLARARSRHGETYDYSHVAYRTARVPVTIICPIHGRFRQVPDTHLAAGCRKCADEALPGAYSVLRIEKEPALASKRARLYYVELEGGGEKFRKLGITVTTIARRLSSFAALGCRFKVLAQKVTTLRNALRLEQSALQAMPRTYRYTPKRRWRRGRSPIGGHNECFKSPLPRSQVVHLFGRT